MIKASRSGSPKVTRSRPVEALVGFTGLDQALVTRFKALIEVARFYWPWSSFGDPLHWPCRSFGTHQSLIKVSRSGHQSFGDPLHRAVISFGGPPKLDHALVKLLPKPWSRLWWSPPKAPWSTLVTRFYWPWSAGPLLKYLITLWWPASRPVEALVGFYTLIKALVTRFKASRSGSPTLYQGHCRSGSPASRTVWSPKRDLKRATKASRPWSGSPKLWPWSPKLLWASRMRVASLAVIKAYWPRSFGSPKLDHALVTRFYWPRSFGDPLHWPWSRPASTGLDQALVKPTKAWSGFGGPASLGLEALVATKAWSRFGGPLHWPRSFGDPPKRDQALVAPLHWPWSFGGLHWPKLWSRLLLA